MTTPVFTEEMEEGLRVIAMLLSSYRSSLLEEGFTVQESFLMTLKAQEDFIGAATRPPGNSGEK